jgi:hypothetical protein
MQLTPEELRVASLFAAMPPEAKVRFPTWFVELVLPLVMAVAGWLLHYPALVGAAFGGLLTLHAHRVFRQFKFARELQSICSKAQAQAQRNAPGA